MSDCTKNHYSKIVSQSIAGNWVIEGNRKVWYTEDGGRWVQVEGQYTGPVGAFTSDGQIKKNAGWYGNQLGSWGGK